MKRILFIFGGCSSEYGVSLQSAGAVLHALDQARYTPIMLGITKEGRWLYYTGDVGAIVGDQWQKNKMDIIPCTPIVDRGEGAILLLDGSERRVYFDAVFPVLHGKNGEDGTMQGLFELMGVPVIGCGMLSGALCMDKDRAHRLVAERGIRVPKSVTFRKSDSMACMEEAAKKVGYLLFIKPVRAGSSYGISKVGTRVALGEAVKEAFKHDDTIIMEETISGFEVGCAVMGTDTLTVGFVDEIEISSGFFNFEEKYTLKTSKIHCPARISEEMAARVKEIAKQIYHVLGCKGFARVDMFVTPEGAIVFNEVNTIPGFTDHSRYPNMMKGVGIDFSTLISRLIEEGVSA